MKKRSLSMSMHSLPAMLLAGAMALGAVATSCSSAKQSSSSSVVPEGPVAGPQGFGAYQMSPGPAALPQARIYRTSIDVDAYVPVTVNPVDGKLVSYPAPTDITGASMPVVLKDGWLLDRRGISPNTRFINYTYSKYHDLSEAPSPAELQSAIIPDARVTEIVELPYKIGEVTPAMAYSIIADGLKRCDVTYKATAQ